LVEAAVDVLTADVSPLSKALLKGFDEGLGRRARV
jgi:hypothetical protein